MPLMRSFSKGIRIDLALLFGIQKMRSSMLVASGTPPRAPQGVLGDGVGSVNRRRPLIPLEEHFRVLQKEQRFLLRIL